MQRTSWQSKYKLVLGIFGLLLFVGSCGVAVRVVAQKPTVASTTRSTTVTDQQTGATNPNATPESPALAANNTITQSSPTSSTSTPNTSSPNTPTSTGMIGPAPKSVQTPVANPNTPPTSSPDLESVPNPSVTNYKELGAILGHAYNMTNGEACGNPAGYCQRSYQTTIQVIRADTSEYVMTITTGKDGSFALRLKAGSYLFIPHSDGLLGPSADPQKITIADEQTIEVNFYYYSMMI